MINKLTPEQEAKIPEYLNYWLSVGKRTETIDREKAKNAMDFLYTKILNINKPKHYIFLDSPMACQLLLNSTNKLRNQFRDQLGNQLWNQLEDQLGNQLKDQLWNQLEDQLRNQLRNQLEDQLWNQLRNQLGNKLWNQLRNKLGNQGLEFIYETRSNFNQNWMWFYSFILNEIFPEKRKNFGLFLEYLEHSKHYHYVYLFPEIAVLSDFPTNLEINEEGKLHSLDKKAMEYRDGWGFYSTNGKSYDNLVLALID